MFITVITDCQSPNEKGRQETRLMSLFQQPVSFVGISSDLNPNATLEAAGNLIDVLDAAEDRKGVVISNVAPRGDQETDGYNGTAFSYFYYQGSLVISTVKWFSLSLVKKLGLVDEIKLMDVDTVVDHAVTKGWLDPAIQDYVKQTQFRSYDFVPRLARWLYEGKTVPTDSLKIDEVNTMPECIWYVDAFGNCKSTLLPEEVGVEPGNKVVTNVGEFMFYPRLKDLPDGETAMYVGSSGLPGRRFIELATQKRTGSAAKTLDLKVGDEITVE